MTDVTNFIEMCKTGDANLHQIKKTFKALRAANIQIPELAMDTAVMHDQLRTTIYLENHSCFPSYLAFEYAAENGKTELASFLSEFYAPYGNSLELAIINHHWPVVEVMLECVSSCVEEGHHLLAVQQNHLRTVRCLFNLKETEVTHAMIRGALNNKNKAMVDLLLSKGGVLTPKHQKMYDLLKDIEAE